MTMAVKFKQKKLPNNKAVKIKSLGQILWEYGEYAEEVAYEPTTTYRFNRFGWIIDKPLRELVLGKFVLIDGVNRVKFDGPYSFYIPEEWIAYRVVDDDDFEI